MVTVTPIHLRSLREIQKQFGVGRETVLRWMKAGAPIAVEATGGCGKEERYSYSAEYNALQEWRVAQGGSVGEENLA